MDKCRYSYTTALICLNYHRVRCSAVLRRNCTDGAFLLSPHFWSCLNPKLLILQLNQGEVKKKEHRENGVWSICLCLQIFKKPLPSIQLSRSSVIRLAGRCLEIPSQGMPESSICLTYVGLVIKWTTPAAVLQRWSIRYFMTLAGEELPVCKKIHFHIIWCSSHIAKCWEFPGENCIHLSYGCQFPRGALEIS